MMALLIILGVLITIGCIPVGVRAVYDGDAAVYLTVLGIPIRLYPMKKKENPEKSKESAAKEKKKFQVPPRAQLEEYLHLLLEVLGRFRRRLVVRKLTLRAVFGGDDPADAALNYGRAWAAIGVVMPLIEQCFTIRRRDVGAFLQEGETTLSLRAEAYATLTVGRMLHLALLALYRFLKIYRSHKNQPEKAV